MKVWLERIGNDHINPLDAIPTDDTCNLYLVDVLTELKEMEELEK